MTPRAVPDGGAGGGPGESAAAPGPVPGGDEPTPPTTADRIAETGILITRLEGELAAARQAGDEARATRARVALAAAEGDPAARAELEAATAAAARAVLGAENVELALAAARERLAGLETRLRAEAREALRRKNVRLCRERVALAGRIDPLLAELGGLVETWSALGLTLYGASVMNDEPGVVGGMQFIGPAVLRHALPGPLAAALGLKFFAGDYRSLAEADPAAATVRHADAAVAGSAAVVDASPGFPTAAEILGSPPVPPPAPNDGANDGATPDEADAGDPAADPVEVRRSASDALLSGLRVVGRMPGGGAITERVA